MKFERTRATGVSERWLSSMASMFAARAEAYLGFRSACRRGICVRSGAAVSSSFGPPLCRIY
jgi:hypothetical protein